MDDTTEYGDAERSDDDYEYEPGVRLSERLRGVRDAVFGDWRPDARTVGLLLVVAWVTGLANSLGFVDLYVRALSQTLQHDPLFPSRFFARDIALYSERLVAIPAELLVVGGGVTLMLRQRWGRPMALAGLVVLALTEVVELIVELVTSVGPGGYPLRLGIVDSMAVLSSVAAIAVVLWSRPAPAPQL